MSDAVQVALITGVAAALPTLFVAVLNYLKNRKRDRTVDDIHTLVNSQMGEQLLIGMVSARTLAETNPTEENKRLAAVAEQKYLNHQAKQSRVDGRKNAEW